MKYAHNFFVLCFVVVFWVSYRFTHVPRVLLHWLCSNHEISPKDMYIIDMHWPTTTHCKAQSVSICSVCDDPYAMHALTCWGCAKMAATLQTIFANKRSWKITALFFLSQFNRNLFLVVQCHKKPILIEITGEKSLSEPIWTSALTYICVPLPQAFTLYWCSLYLCRMMYDSGTKNTYHIASCQFNSWKVKNTEQRHGWGYLTTKTA